MTTTLGIIADDLTGSLDTGVQFSKWGLACSVSLKDTPLSEESCVIINTDSRAVSPGVAARRVQRAARLLRGRKVYKKIDSTLRGNLGVEISTAMQELGMDKAVIAPAFPANGRTTLDGYLYVRGVPLGQTGVAHDPRSAVDESHVPTLLKQQGARPVALVGIDTVERGTDAIRHAIAHCSESYVVVDVETQKHLSDIAQALTHSDEAWLPVGSAGLAEAIPAALGLSETETRTYQAPHTQGPVLIVAGSRNEVTAVQVREAANALGLPTMEPDLQLLLALDDNPGALEHILSTTGQHLERGLDVIVTTSFVPQLEEKSSDIALALGRLTSDIMQRSRVGGLFLTGGDIALQVCLALDGRALRPVREVAPGLPLSLLGGGPWDDTPVVTKAGGFGESDSMVAGIRSLKDWSDNERH